MSTAGAWQGIRSICHKLPNMEPRHARRAALASFLLLASGLAQAQVRFSELHYDNTGTDAGEAIEISGPAGTDLTGWSVVLYNGSGGAPYDTDALTGVIPATCDARGVVVLNYAVNGIQNGAPDGLALVDAGGAVVEFLSYEGTFAAVGGPANGMTSTDIGVLEVGNEPLGLSLQRGANGTWNAPAASTFGTCNDGDPQPPAEVVSVTVAPPSATLNVNATVQLTATALDANGQPVPGTAFTWTSSAPAIASVSITGLVTGLVPGDASIAAAAPNGVSGSSAVTVNAVQPPTSEVRLSEIHYDNAGTDTGEAIEVRGPAGTDLTGYSVVLYNLTGGAVYSTRALSGALPATCGANGVMVLTYPQDGIQNGPQDGFALVDNAGAVVEFLSYEGVLTAANGPAVGRTSVDIGVAQSSAPIGVSLQRDSSNVWRAAPQSFGLCNEDASPGVNVVTFTGRFASDPPLPVGYQDQIFATLEDFLGTDIPTTFVFASDTPAIASIDQNGVFTALAEGSAILRATAADGTTGTITLPTRVAVEGTTAQYADNAEFGEPADGDASDDFIVRYPQFTASYNVNRGSPNWVSYNLDATHFGPEDRCDCFTPDPALPSSFPQISTADYTGSGAFHGYGIDRGHMTRSFDRTTGSLDNARTYLFSNIVPQAADLNQGPWAIFENFLGDQARLNNREVYIVTGVAGNRGTLKNEGRVVIPTHTWKVALLMPRDEGLAQVRDYRYIEVMAVMMPNDPGVRNVDWSTYLTTVDFIEATTGYDLLARLPDDVEAAVESNTMPPIAAISGPAAVNEDQSTTFSAAASVDPNGTIVSYEWTFGDGSTATGVGVAHTFAQDGVYQIVVTVTDNDGLTDTAALTVEVANVQDVTPPVIQSNVTGTLGNGGWYVSDAQVSWTVTDGESPIDQQTGCDANTVNTDTAGITFTCSATSEGGTATASVTIRRDATAPTAKATASPWANLLGWRTTDVTVRFTGTDALSGGVTCDPPVILSIEGANQSASGRCYDAAGNQSALATASGIDIDKTDPAISIAAPSDGATYRHKQVVIASYSCTDGVSGMLICLGTVPNGRPIDTSRKVKDAKLAILAVDRAGNTKIVISTYSVN